MEIIIRNREKTKEKVLSKNRWNSNSNRKQHPGLQLAACRVQIKILYRTVCRDCRIKENKTKLPWAKNIIMAVQVVLAVHLDSFLDSKSSMMTLLGFKICLNELNIILIL